MNHLGTERTEDGYVKRDEVVVLVDDTRAFRDGRHCLVARSSEAAVKMLQDLRNRRIDHLWLDHDLGGDDTIWPAIRLLEAAHIEGRPFNIGVIHVQASRSGPAHQIGVSVRRLGYVTDRSRDPRLWSRWDGRPSDHRRTSAQHVSSTAAESARMDEDALWAVFTALSATCEMVAPDDEAVHLVMDLQEEALELVRDIVDGSQQRARA